MDIHSHVIYGVDDGAETIQDSRAMLALAAALAAACFVRVYDSAHLRRHPLQKVKMMKLLVTGEPAEDKPGLSYSFRMGVGFVKKPGNFDSSGDCGFGRHGYSRHAGGCQHVGRLGRVHERGPR